MAKSSKKSKQTTAPENLSSESSNGQSAAEAAQPVAAKKAAAKTSKGAKNAAKPRGTTVKRTATGTRSPRAKKTAPAAASSSVTDEQVRMRAYFISEWRIQNGIAGDSANDWLEARRQLQSEAARA